MENTEFKVYPYRWIMLTVFMLMIAVNQMLWITFAPITMDAVHFYNVSELQIGLLSMCFMIVFIVMSIPASWIIDTYGIRIGVGIGALLTGVFGMMRGMVQGYDMVLTAQIGIAVAQPFLLNAITKLSSRWFRVDERATAAGLGTLSMYIGVLVGMILTPILAKSIGISQLLYWYGIISVGVALLFILLAKERPATAPCAPEMEERSLVYDGLKNAMSNRNFILLLVIFFIGLGVFNSVTTWIEQILGPRGFNAEQAGLSGGMMIIGGIVGALILPILSDKYKNRKFFIQLALAGAVLGLAGVTFATNYTLLLISSAVLGFFLLSAGPIGFQYGAEITYPTSEGTSNGMMILAGQISGILFIYGMDYFKSSSDNSMTSSLIVMIVLTFLCLIIASKLKESSFMTPSNKTIN